MSPRPRRSTTSVTSYYFVSAKPREVALVLELTKFLYAKIQVVISCQGSENEKGMACGNVVYGHVMDVPCVGVRESSHTTSRVKYSQTSLTQTSHINIQRIHNGNHLLASQYGRHDGWAERIAAEHGDDLAWLSPLLRSVIEEFISGILDRCDEWRGLLGVVDVVEVEEGDVCDGRGKICL